MGFWSLKVFVSVHSYKYYELLSMHMIAEMVLTPGGREGSYDDLLPVDSQWMNGSLLFLPFYIATRTPAIVKGDNPLNLVWFN